MIWRESISRKRFMQLRSALELPSIGHGRREGRLSQWRRVQPSRMSRLDEPLG